MKNSKPERLPRFLPFAPARSLSRARAPNPPSATAPVSAATGRARHRWRVHLLPFLICVMSCTVTHWAFRAPGLATSCPQELHPYPPERRRPAAVTNHHRHCSILARECSRSIVAWWAKINRSFSFFLHTTSTTWARQRGRSAPFRRRLQWIPVLPPRPLGMCASFPATHSTHPCSKWRPGAFSQACADEAPPHVTAPSLTPMRSPPCPACGPPGSFDRTRMA
jgi:hypothetical protein